MNRMFLPRVHTIPCTCRFLIVLSSIKIKSCLGVAALEYDPLQQLKPFQNEGTVCNYCFESTFLQGSRLKLDSHVTLQSSCTFQRRMKHVNSCHY